MINPALLLFIILLLGLVLCSFLGGRNCLKESFTADSSSGPNGSSIKTVTGVSGNTASIAVGPQGNLYTTSNVNDVSSATSIDSIHKNTFYGPNGGSAKVTNVKGTYQIEVTDAAGNTTHYTYTPPTASSGKSASGSTSTSTSGTSSNATIQGLTFYGPYGGKAQVVTGNDGNYLIRISYPSGQSIDYTVTNPYINNPNAQSVDSTINQGGMYPNTSTSADYYSGATSGSMSNSVPGYDYSNSLPPGIPRSMIPPGQEDLYILKSEVVPPVCPVCPTSTACPKEEEKCPPCPACARCPEPSFECKKVPNYNAINNTYLPVPVLNDFSSFGM